MKQLKTQAHGFFSNDNSIYINLEVSKSSPNRKGEVIKVNNFGKVLQAEIKFRDFTDNIVCSYE